MSDSDLINPTDSDGGPRKDIGSLTGRQVALYDALVEKDRQVQRESVRLAEMYRGALSVLNQEYNPDRLAQAAHSLRELMEKLPRAVDVPAAQGDGLTVRVRRVHRRWRLYTKISSDGPKRVKVLTGFQTEMEKFAVWFEERDKTRRQIAGQLIDRLDQRKTSLPAQIKDVHVDEWDLCHKYFEDTSHHSKTTIDEFDGWLVTLETFLLDRLRPRTFDDQVALKTIVIEGETDAEP